MLGRIVLILIQFGITWRVAPEISRLLPELGDLRIFALAVAFAVLVWLIGVVGHLVLKDVAQPTPSTLAVAMVFALILAGATLVPEVMTAVGKVMTIQPLLYPLIGAVLGYAIKR